MYEREWGLCTHTFMLICTEKLFGIGVRESDGYKNVLLMWHHEKRDVLNMTGFKLKSKHKKKMVGHWKSLFFFLMHIFS